MILFESMLPADRRQNVAALVRSATQSCQTRRHFYAVAAASGLRAACASLGSRAGSRQEFVTLLSEELDDVEAELTRKAVR